MLRNFNSISHHFHYSILSSLSLPLNHQGNDHVNEDVTELKIMLQKEATLRKRAEEEIHNLRNSQLLSTEVWIFYIQL